MKNIINTIKENIKLILGVLLFGLVIGLLIGKSTNQQTNTSSDRSANQHIEESANQIWTCSMHPQIKQDKPGLCPICAMDLIPLTTMSSGGDDVDPNEIVMTESAAKLADIVTMKVSKGVPQKTVYLQGKVHADERNVAELTARFGGRIEKLFVNFTGQNVRKGEKLATIYSPGLVTAQRELLEAISFKETRPSLYVAAKGKLKLWDLTDKQISVIETQGEPQLYFDVLSPISGTVSMRHVAIGDYVKEGSPLFKVIDLTKVWVMFDAYESDLPWIKMGDKVDFTIQALPGKNFTAKVSFIDPFISEQTRVAKVRVEVPNQKMTLKPEMFTAGLLESKIAESSNEILVPKSSILWTGKRAVVYVKVQDRETPSFLYREVVLGPEAGAFFVVKEGLHEGEEIATNGVFKIDAASQLIGLPSMMNPSAAGGAASTGHNHGDMGASSSNEHAGHIIDDATLQHETFKVAGNCEMCKSTIEKAAKSLAGVNEANWNTETKKLHVSFNKDKSSLASIHKAIAKAGYDTEKETAPQEAYDKLPGCCKYTRDASDKVKADVKHAEFQVSGNCEMCKDRIETAAKSVDGANKAEWNVESKMIHVSFDSKASLNSIHKAIAKVGHDTKKEKANNEMYNKLPGCCKYTRD